MKPLTFKLIALLLIIGLGNTQESFAYAKKEFSKVIQKEFSTSAEGNVYLENRYGDVNIQTWDKNQVAIEVTILVEANSEENANKVFDRINIDLSNTSSSISAVTSIEDSSSSWSWWSGWSNNNDDDFKIHYEVKMPSTNQLDLKNKYGNSYVALLDAPTKVEIKYGNLQMEGINNDLELIMGYGNGTISHAKNVDIDVKYSQLEFEEVKDVNIISKYSALDITQLGDLKSSSKYDKYDLGTLNELRSDGKYDKFRIKEINQLTATAKYSHYTIEKLMQRADLELSYGGAKIRALAPNFTEVNLDGSYADFNIEIANVSNYQLDIQTKYADLRYPIGIDLTHEEKDNFSENIKGNMGGKSGGLIKARLNYGGIKID